MAVLCILVPSGQVAQNGSCVCVKACGKNSRGGSTFREHNNTTFIILSHL